MISIPRWWLATVYFVAFLGMASIGADDKAAHHWWTVCDAAASAMFFIGFGWHFTVLMKDAWRLRRCA